MENLGYNLSVLRKQRDLTQRELSMLLDLSPSMISQIEKGRTIASINVLQRYASVFGIPISTLLLNNLIENLNILSRDFEIDEILASPLRRFFLNFPDFVKYFKGKDIEFDVLKIRKGLRFEIKESKGVSETSISEYLYEFINAASNRLKVTEIEFEREVSKKEIEDIRHEFEQEVFRLKEKIEFLTKQNNLLINSNNVLSLLAYEIGLETKTNMNQIKAGLIKVNEFSKSILNEIRSQLGDKYSKDEIQSIIETSYDDKIQDLIQWLEIAFRSSQIQELENFIEIENQLNELKKKSDWESKIKIALPLAEYVGVKIETEQKFNLKRHMNKIKEECDKLIIRMSS